MRINDRLPKPSREEMEHSDRVREYIAAKIHANGGIINFADYMHHALYAPGLGYYSAGLQKFGAQGDFLTAPEISSLFSLCIARFIEGVLTMLGNGDVLEVGPGSGVMASDMWSHWCTRSVQPTHHFLLEVSADLKARQRARIAAQSADVYSRIHWLDDLPRSGFRGVIVANEVLDAMPVHVFDSRNDAVWERHVRIQGNLLAWEPIPITEGPVSECVLSLMEHWRTDGVSEYQSEINFAMCLWLTRVAEMLDQGVILVLDYGYPRREYYHPQRSQGTLMCYYKHHGHSDPLIYPGLQDITASIDFTALADTALACGLDVLSFTTQAHFLLSTGLGELMAYEANDNEMLRLKRAQEAKKLLMPSEMGELIKVLVLGKNLPEDIPALHAFDLRSKL